MGKWAFSGEERCPKTFMYRCLVPSARKKKGKMPHSVSLCLFTVAKIRAPKHFVAAARRNRDIRRCCAHHPRILSNCFGVATAQHPSVPLDGPAAVRQVTQETGHTPTERGLNSGTEAISGWMVFLRQSYHTSG